MNKQITNDYGFRLGLEDGRRDAEKKPDIRLRDKGFGLANSLDSYAQGFRQGFDEKGGKR
jgi:hypothetical protein